MQLPLRKNMPSVMGYFLYDLIYQLEVPSYKSSKVYLPHRLRLQHASLLIQNH